jgi:hypothetical protein
VANSVTLNQELKNEPACYDFISIICIVFDPNHPFGPLPQIAEDSPLPLPTFKTRAGRGVSINCVSRLSKTGGGAGRTRS